MANSDKVKEFYDGFSKNILINEFYNFSLRQDAIRKLCSAYIPKGARILEMGCGVGIVTKHIQKDASFVLSVDISQANVRTAGVYAAKENTKFDIVDITKETEKVKSFGKFDAVLIFDVIEHIEKENYKELFAVIEDLLSEKGMVLLTYPAPQYQEYLKANNPKALQVIDQTVLLTDILNQTKLYPYYYSYKDIWDKDQYIHLVLKKNISYPVVHNKGLIGGLAYRIKKYTWRLRHVFIKKRINELFSDK